MAGIPNYAFNPGVTISLSVTATSATAAMPTGAGTVFRVINAGGNLAFFTTATATGSSATAGGTTSTPIIAGGTELFTLDPSGTFFAAVCATGGTTTLYVTRGQGF